MNKRGTRTAIPDKRGCDAWYSARISALQLWRIDAAIAWRVGGGRKGQENQSRSRVGEPGRPNQMTANIEFE